MARRPLTRLEYGVPTDRCSASVLLGIEKGFFRDEGIDLSVRVIFGGPELAAAYDSGALVFGEIGSPPAVTAISCGARFRIVGGGLRRGALMFLGVRTALHEYGELRGRRVGVLTAGSCTDWVGRAMLLRAGLKPDVDVSLIGLKEDYSRILSVMADGRIDAMVAGEPHLSIGETGGLLRVWCAAYEADYLPRFQWYVLVANERFVEEHPDVLRAALRAYRRASRYAIENLEELLEFSVERYGIPMEAARRSVERELPHLHLDAAVDLPGLKRVVELQQGLGAVKGALEVETLLDARFCAVELSDVLE